MFNFNALLDEDDSPPPTHPVEIFHSLPRTGTKYAYLRSVQADVLNEWQGRRGDRDVIIKMNTGSGKTLVGLLMLQSVLNEQLGPVLYLCPNKQLVEQVYKTAQSVNIPSVVGEDRAELPHEFLNSEAIFITTFKKLFNGKTMFGIPGSYRPIVPLGGVLVDDAHSCLSIAREGVTITFEAGKPDYKKLRDLFGSALGDQSPTRFAEVEEGRPYPVMPVPYWAWIDRRREVAKILAAVSDKSNNSFTFGWDLVKEDIAACHCFVSGNRIEITPHIVPIETVPSFAQAKRRFFLSATLVDDSILLKEFGVTMAAASKTIRPPLVGDIGERMILAPSLIDSELEPQIPELCKTFVKEGYNVVVLVPSFNEKDTSRWAAAGATVVKADDVSPTINKLQTTNGNFVVLANRYDGIDLPDDACRILVVDGLPAGSSYFEQHLSSVRSSSPLVIGRVAQTIEQGLGRGVRSGTDYCVALLGGPQLVQFIGMKDRLSLFSPETRQQFLIGQEIAKRVKQDAGTPLEKLASLMQQCLKKDKGWKKYHAAKMVGLTQTTQDPRKLEIAVAEREAARRYQAGNANEACEVVRQELDPNTFPNDTDKGWFVQLAANYLHSAEPTSAQEMQKRAHEWNPQLFRSVSGVRYQKIIAKTGPQAQAALAWIQNHVDPNAIRVGIEGLITSLVLGVHHTTFEEAWLKLGAAIGFRSQWPENEQGKGPDGLWAMPENHYLLTEIKNEVEANRTEIYQSETEQMGNSQNWFVEHYGKNTPVTLLMIHRVNILAASAYPPDSMVVMTPKKLELLHTQLRAYAAALASKAPEVWTVGEVGTLLANHRLDAGSIRTTYCVKYKRK